MHHKYVVTQQGDQVKTHLLVIFLYVHAVYLLIYLLTNSNALKLKWWHMPRVQSVES